MSSSIGPVVNRLWNHSVLATCGTSPLDSLTGQDQLLFSFDSANDIHSLQATGTSPDGAEFLLIFDSGSFSEDSTFLLTVCGLIAMKCDPH